MTRARVRAMKKGMATYFWGGYSQSARKGDRTCDPLMRRSTSHSSSNQYPIRISYVKLHILVKTEFH